MTIQDTKTGAGRNASLNIGAKQVEMPARKHDNLPL